MKYVILTLYHEWCQSYLVLYILHTIILSLIKLTCHVSFICEMQMIWRHSHMLTFSLNIVKQVESVNDYNSWWANFTFDNPTLEFVNW